MMLETEKLRVKIIDEQMTDTDLALYVFELYQENRRSTDANILRDISKVGGSDDIFDIEIIEGDKNREDAIQKLQNLIIGGVIEIISNIE